MLDREITAQIVDHMNQDHADAVLLYARVFGGRADAESARLVDFETGGMTLRCSCGGAEVDCRIDFDKPVETAGGARQLLVEMARQARARIESS